jgi:hypothetical protein
MCTEMVKITLDWRHNAHVLVLMDHDYVDVKSIDVQDNSISIIKLHDKYVVLVRNGEIHSVFDVFNGLAVALLDNEKLKEYLEVVKEFFPDLNESFVSVDIPSLDTTNIVILGKFGKVFVLVTIKYYVAFLDVFENFEKLNEHLKQHFGFEINYNVYQ